MLPVAIGSILLGLALLIVVGLFLLRPFFKAPPQAAMVGKRQELLLRKEASLEAIRALDFDHDTGKLPDEEYEQQRTALMRDAALTLKALDKMPAGQADEDVYAQIVAAVSLIRQQRAASAGSPAHFCTNCGQSLDASDKFCAHCGQPVYAVQPST